MKTKAITETTELEEDKLYSFEDLRIKATTDYDFRPIIIIYSDKGRLIITPSSDNKIGVQSTNDL